MALFKKKSKLTPLEKEKQRALNFIKEYREKYVPKEYNQIELIDHLLEPEIDYLVSISNRSDGKSFNYIGCVMALSIEFDTGFTLIARHYTLRKVYYNLLMKIAHKIPFFDSKKLMAQSTDHYIIVIYGEKPIGVITDLNAATDLKYSSNFLVDFPIMLYDEFLAIETDYLPDEAERLKTIYESLDREFSKSDTRILDFPKIILLGNAVNFSSPLLAYLDLFNKLEKQPINSAKQYENIWLEMRRNDHSNEKRNLRAFPTKDDAMTSGQFKFNKYALASENDRNAIKSGIYREFNIKLLEYYLNVRYNRQRNLIMLSIKSDAENYAFCTEVSDKQENVIYLKDTFYSDTHYKKHERGLFKYDNAFSKSFITRDMQLINLKIIKCVKLYDTKHKEETISDRHEREYRDQYIENTKKAIMQRFFSWGV